VFVADNLRPDEPAGHLSSSILNKNGWWPVLTWPFA
jgi:hypothetical protein